MALFPVVYVSHPKHVNGLAIILYSSGILSKNLIDFPPKAFHNFVSILKSTDSFMGWLQLPWIPVSHALEGSYRTFSPSLAVLCSASFQQTVPYFILYYKLILYIIIYYKLIIN
jgi:hypothetical protein